MAQEGLIKVTIHDPGFDPPAPLLYSIIAARYLDRWIFVRHRERTTWEMPGGHIEEGETADQTATRELQEETGAKRFTIDRMATYSVKDGKYAGWGRFYFARIDEMGKLPPGSEIGEVKTAGSLPENLTHPLIQPVLFRWLVKRLEQSS